MKLILLALITMTTYSIQSLANNTITLGIDNSTREVEIPSFNGLIQIDSTKQVEPSDLAILELASKQTGFKGTLNSIFRLLRRREPAHQNS